ncbi:MAG: RbsD/FucU domain-containing protein [Bacteroidota bacterium]
MEHQYIALSVVTLILFGGIVRAQSGTDDWKTELKEQVGILGHRNWILVVDAAYPLQSNPAIKTVVTGENQLDVVNTVLNAIDQAPHIFPVVFLDKEIDFVPEADAKGIKDYKTRLDRLLEGKKVNKIAHEDLIAQVDESANTFSVLVLKTNLTIPYTSVFLRLECGYWDEDSEQRLRKKMKME